MGDQANRDHVPDHTPGVDLTVGRPAAAVLRSLELDPTGDGHRALPPELHDPPDAPLVKEPVDEPLVAIDHPRIMPLESYRAAGWRHVIPGTWLRADVAQRLYRVAEALPERWGLCVFDAWRPLALQEELYHHTYVEPTLSAGSGDDGPSDDRVAPPPGFLAPPSTDPRTPPPHLTGGTVDLSLTIDGVPLALGTVFDDFTAAAHTRSLEAAEGPERVLRRQLYWAMRAQGFVVLHQEWWHFEIGTRRWAAITGRAPRYGPAAPPPAVRPG